MGNNAFMSSPSHLYSIPQPTFPSAASIDNGISAKLICCASGTKQPCKVKVTRESVIVMFKDDQQPIKLIQITNIRRYGAQGEMFIIERGKSNDSGQSAVGSRHNGGGRLTTSSLSGRNMSSSSSLLTGDRAFLVFRCSKTSDAQSLSQAIEWVINARIPFYVNAVEGDCRNGLSGPNLSSDSPSSSNVAPPPYDHHFSGNTGFNRADSTSTSLNYLQVHLGGDYSKIDEQATICLRAVQEDQGQLDGSDRD